jgi:hypothetical protein
LFWYGDIELSRARESRSYVISVLSLFYFQYLRKITAATLNCIPNANPPPQFPQKIEESEKTPFLRAAYPLLFEICDGF